MRVSTSMTYGQARRTIGDRQATLAQVQQSIATGRAVNRPSDDAPAARRILRAEGLLGEVRSNRQTLDQGERLLSISENALTDAGHLTQRVTELTVQFASDTYSAADRRKAADEVVQIRERLIELANAQDNGRFLFGGLGSSEPAFDASGHFTGDRGQLTYPVGRGAEVEVSLPGGEPFETSSPGTSLFDTLSRLETALRADNGSAVGALVDEVREQQDRLTQAQQTIGHRLQRIENVRGALARVEISATQTLQNDREIDLAESIFQLRQAETGLQGVLLVTARLDQLNLTNFL
ncbi:MAG: flagellar hook-associated protein FlgL [Myxococcota bacterium]